MIQRQYFIKYLFWFPFFTLSLPLSIILKYAIKYVNELLKQKKDDVDENDNTMEAENDNTKYNLGKLPTAITLFLNEENDVESVFLVIGLAPLSTISMKATTESDY